jgi:hypothetical protein
MAVARRMFPQPDLFETPRPRMVLAPTMRTNLVDQLRVLLMEAMATQEAGAGGGAHARAAGGDAENGRSSGAGGLCLRTSVDGDASHP